jgi:hypothetical protein
MPGSGTQGLITIFLVGMLTGCGASSGPTRYELSGRVLHQGKPVPIGEIILRPDAAAGNDGPGSVATIRDGAYRTEAGRGVVGGPYIVEIMGFDGIPVGESTEGAVLFDPITRKVELSRQAATHDFEVP